MKEINKVFKDYHYYLDEMQEKSCKLTEEQQEKLATVLSSQISLLIALKHHSSLGKVEYNFTI